MLFFALVKCPFCSLSSAHLWIETEAALAFADANPMADGHMVVVLRKHVGTVFELSAAEQKRLWEVLAEVRSRLLTGLTPDGFSVGFNDTQNEVAGADHAAVHVVPRWRGDNLELRAGLEWVTDDSLAAAKK
jgi:diadenosine tetraphosphate (Ap4A) HIT family hydrolase